MSWEEQKRLASVLPQHLAEMVLLAVDPGCRDREAGNRRGEVEVPALDAIVFMIPGPREGTPGNDTSR